MKSILSVSSCGLVDEISWFLEIDYGIESRVFDLNCGMSEGEAGSEHLTNFAQDAVAFACVIDDNVGGDGVAARSDRPDVKVVNRSHAGHRSHGLLDRSGVE